MCVACASQAISQHCAQASEALSLLQDTATDIEDTRLRLSLADPDYSPNRAVVSLVRDLGDTLLMAPAPAAALPPSQANTVSLALADVVDHDLQSR